MHNAWDPPAEVIREGGERRRAFLRAIPLAEGLEMLQNHGLAPALPRAP